MSVEDAEKYIDSVRITHKKVAENEVIIFVDYREDNRIRAAKKDGVPEMTLLQALESVHVARRVGTIVRCVLKAGDAIIARVVPRPIVVESSSSSSSSSDPSELARRRAINENITIEGLNVYDAMVSAEDALDFDCIVAYERKTLDDLISSSKARNNASREQHLDEQIGRLLVFCQATGAQPRLLLEKYAENELNGTKSGVQVIDHAHSGLTHLALFDGVAPWHSDGTVGSARLLLKDARQIHTERYVARGWTRMGTGADRAATLKMAISKADNHDVSKWFRGCLEAIPLMSQERAMLIMDQFPTMLTLVKAFDDCASDKDRLELISEIKQNGRRLGDSAAHAVLDRFYSGVPPPPPRRRALPIKNTKNIKSSPKKKMPAKKKLKVADSTSPPVTSALSERPPQRRASTFLTKLLETENPELVSSSSEDEDFTDDDDDDETEDVSDDDDDDDDETEDVSDDDE